MSRVAPEINKKKDAYNQSVKEMANMSMKMFSIKLRNKCK